MKFKTNKKTIYQSCNKNPNKITKMYLNVFIICFLLFISASATMTLLGFDTQTKLTTDHLTCLQSKYYLEETYIQLYNYGGIVPSVNENLLKQVFITPHAIIILLPTDTLSSDWAIQKWTSHILTHNYKSLWISWSMGGGYKIDCLGVWKIITALRKVANEVGIFMSQQRWEDNEYLNIGYCQNLNKLPLFAQDVSHFEPFNGWNDYKLKISVIAEGVCEIDEIQIVDQKAAIQ